ncbi:MAG: 6-phosphogluconolactonase [Sulfurimonas sp.]|nr:6-phosphogluconolactonase [Sulfurimonas sp.]MBU3939035.1 6-phosphogluconolactonase [bacterium]MBU4025608.1 6-phosphogluconolactonase [bacterium]MBU4059646.1 6-phosphogluconolactonase [bacterium]MBU4109456.1 6-phosphogluconolactonase [bacterium]
MGEVGMANNYYTLNEFSSKEKLVEALSQKIIDDLAFAIETKGYATLVLSGGSTPKNLLNALSNIKFDWKKVRVTLVDERWVDPSNPNSNQKMVQDYLLQNHATKARFIPLKNSAIRAKDAVVSLEVALHGLSHELDVVVLGMGEDAHTASFFPHSSELAFALNTNDLCCATTAVLEPRERITLSRSFLLSSKNLILHIEGQAKKEVFQKAVKSDDVVNMPIVAMMQQKTPLLEVYYAD